MHDKKYRLKTIEEFNLHNDIYDDMEGCICYLAYLKVGERGWFLCETPYGFSAHRVHTSIIDRVYYWDSEIIVETQNTRFTFVMI